MHKTMRSFFVLFTIICSTLLIGCGARVPVIKPFKLDIQQGNVVTSKMLLQLRPGMTKSQVKFIMGTPLVIDSFHTNRWDYFYQLRQAGKIVEQRRVILDFEKDLLARVRGDVVPQGTPGAEGSVALANETTAASKPVVKEGLLENLQFWKSNQIPEAEPPEAEKVDKPKETDKSLLDKLKFWETDKPAVKSTADSNLKPDVKSTGSVNSAEPLKDALPAVLPIVAAPVIGADALSADSETTEADKPSMLAVPIEIAPESTAQMPAENMPATIEPAAVPAQVTPAVTDVTNEMVKETTVSETLPADSAPSAVINGEERFIFRFDRHLNTKNLENTQTQQLKPTEVSPTLKANTVKEISAPAAEEPGYFERMLEKIGF